MNVIEITEKLDRIKMRTAIAESKGFVASRWYLEDVKFLLDRLAEEREVSTNSDTAGEDGA